MLHGKGDYGSGFYVFGLCGDEGDLGLEKAIQWAKLKQNDTGFALYLVYLRMKRERYETLRLLRIENHQTPEIFDLYFDDKLTGYDGVYGPVLTGFGQK